MWTQLRIPKSEFKRDGTGAYDWSDVYGIRFTAKTNTANNVKVYVDDIRLQGGVGLQGDYRHRIGFYNSTTGCYSNPNPTDVVTEQVDRQGILLSGLPTSCADPQVDMLAVWRTMGNGFTFFLVETFALGPATYLDEVADYYGLNSDTDAEYLQAVELALDADPPLATFDHCVGPFQGRMWWLNDAALGYVYYSAEGRPESMQGFVNVTEAGDPLKRLVLWGGHLYVFSEQYVYEILGNTEPFIYREFDGVPGTSAPYTVVATSIGIVYEARVGMMVFDGNSSRLLSPDAMLPIFQGQARSGVAPFNGIVAAAWHGRYYISDADRTFVVNIDEKNTLLGRTDGEWCEFGLGFNAFYSEADTDELLGATPTNVVSLEKANVTTDVGAGIPFMLETLAIPVGIGRKSMLQRLYVDADMTSANDELKPTLILDDATEVALPVAVQLQRGKPVEYSLLKVARLVALRLECSATNKLEVFEIGFDIHVWPAGDSPT